MKFPQKCILGNNIIQKGFRIGLVFLIGALIGATPWITDVFAADPSLYLQCEGTMKDAVNGLNPAATGITYGSGPPGLGQAAKLPIGATAAFSNSGFWVSSIGTFAAWIKPIPDFNTDSDRHDIFAVGNEPNFHLSWIGGKQGSPVDPAGTLNFKAKPPGFDGCNLYASIKNIFNDNDWHHVACSWGSSGKKIYVDGVLKSSYSYPVYTGPSTPVYIGSSSHYGDGQICHANCWMDEIQFYKTQLADNDIRSIYEGVAATPQGIISGRVTDSSGETGLAGVTVTASPGNYATTTQFGTLFNRSAGGYYTLNVPAGTYEVRYSDDGYRTFCYSNVTVVEQENVTVDVSLDTGTGEASCVPFGGETVCSPGNPLYFYVVQKDSGTAMMTVLSLANLCPTIAADDLTVRYHLNEGTLEIVNKPEISINPMGHVLKFSEELTNQYEDSEGWMVVESANTKLGGNESICASPAVDYAAAFPSFAPKNRWTIFYLTALPGWTTMMSVFNPNDYDVPGISIKAYNDTGSLIGESVVGGLISKYQVVRRVQDYFLEPDLGNGWIEIYSPNGPLLVYRYLVAQ